GDSADSGEGDSATSGE
nr:germ specificity regulating peptide [Priestia megaterium]